MFKIDILKSLKDFDESTLNLFIKRLNKSGIISDENSFIESVVIEKWNDDCEKFIRENGYEGGMLKHCSDYYGVQGAAYVMYDTNKYDGESAQDYLDNLMKSKEEA